MRIFNRTILFAIFWPLCHASIIDEIIAALRNMRDCTSCLGSLAPLQSLARLGDDAFVSVFSQVCVSLGMADAEVCAGAVAGSGPIVAHDLRHIRLSGKAARGLCTALFGFCDTKVADPFSVPLPPKSPASSHPAVTAKRREPFKVVHLSDVHIDRRYTPGTEANCTFPVCCRNFANSEEPVLVPAPPNGHFHCDAPVSLIDSMLEAIRPMDAQFAIFTGDIIDVAAVWLIDREEVANDLAEFNEQLASKLDIPVYPSLGNHDSVPVNAFPRTTTGNQSQFVFDTESEGWQRWIGEAAAQQVLHHSGAYSTRVPGTNLRILSINTQYWYRQNFWLYDSDRVQHDPNGVLEFMVKRLYEAELAGDYVWILGHISPGAGDISIDQSNYYDQILQRFQDTIAGQFFGHSHMDQFQIAYSNYSNQTAENAVSVALLGPSATPRGLKSSPSTIQATLSSDTRNPAFKIYEVDPDTFGIVNYQIFFANMSEPSFHTDPVWEEYYDFRKTYGPLVGIEDDGAPLGPGFWHKLTEVFERNDTAFQLYNAFLHRGARHRSCHDQCKNTTICDMRGFRAENNCDLALPGGGFWPKIPRRPTSECEGPTFGDFLLDLAEAANGLRVQT